MKSPLNTFNPRGAFGRAARHLRLISIPLALVLPLCRCSPGHGDSVGQRLLPLTSISEEKCAGIVYNETSGLRPEEIKEGRDFIASVAYKRNGGGMAKPKIPNATELMNPTVKKIWEDCTRAAADAKDDDAGNCIHFVIWPSDDGGKTPTKTPKMSASWPYDYTPASGFGPYKNPVQVGDVPKSDKVYIFKYCAVPLVSKTEPVGRMSSAR